MTNIQPPQNGRRLPPKPSRGDVEALAISNIERAQRAERREIMLSRMIVLVLAGPWYIRAWYAMHVVLGLRLYMPVKLLERVSATQLYANAERKGYVLGADKRAVKS